MPAAATRGCIVWAHSRRCLVCFLGNRGGNFRPLDRVVRALYLIQGGVQVPRGTLLTIFKHKPFGELKRLALSDEAETEIRRSAPDEDGGLVVEQVIEGGPAHNVLQPGDVVRTGG